MSTSLNSALDRNRFKMILQYGAAGIGVYLVIWLTMVAWPNIASTNDKIQKATDQISDHAKTTHELGTSLDRMIVIQERQNSLLQQVCVVISVQNGRSTDPCLQYNGR